jgi:hypothetical protein
LNFKRKCDNNDQNKKNAYQKGKNYKIEFQDNLILKDEIEKQMIKQSILSQPELALQTHNSSHEDRPTNDQR